MKRFVTILLALALTPLPWSVAIGQSQQQPDDVLRVRSNEVRLDIVVKDKKGRSVRDLAPTDFEVLEDGVAQRIRGLHRPRSFE